MVACARSLVYWELDAVGGFSSAATTVILRGQALAGWEVEEEEEEVEEFAAQEVDEKGEGVACSRRAIGAQQCPGRGRGGWIRWRRAHMKGTLSIAIA